MRSGCSIVRGSPRTFCGKRLPDRHPSEFIAIALLLTFALSRLNADLFIVLLKGRQVLTCLGKLSFLHPFSDVPVHKGALRVHQIELMVNAGKNLSDGRGVADHAASAHDLRQVATRDNCRWLVVDT